MAKYIRQPSPYNTQIVALGVDTYLKMLLHDNFVVSFPHLPVMPPQLYQLTRTSLVQTSLDKSVLSKSSETAVGQVNGMLKR